MSINTAIRLFAITASYLLVSPSNAQMNHLGDFALLDSKGQFHQLTRYSDMDAVLLYVNQETANFQIGLYRF